MTPLLRVEDVHFTYLAGTPLAVPVLHGVSLDLRAGEWVGLLGRTGSGKTTLLQHLNGLLHPTSGRVVVDGRDLRQDALHARRRTGMLFQFAEHQLFEETVGADVAFGPRSLGHPREDVERRSRLAMARVGLDWDAFAARSPWSLSGGEKRRVALAGVLATEPALLVLDEPTVGLDAAGQATLLELLEGLRGSLTVVLTSHDVDLVARLADRAIILEGGRLVADGPVEEILGGEAEPLGGVSRPATARLARALRAAGVGVSGGVPSVPRLAQELISWAMKRGGR